MSFALLLIAHGSRRPEANDDLHHVAQVLRERGHAIVVAAYLELAQPDIDRGGALCVEAGAATVVMVPYFLSMGRHVADDLAEARQRLSTRYPGVAFTLAPPLGRHPLLIDILEERVREAT